MNKLEQLIFKKYKDDEILNPILSRILWTMANAVINEWLLFISSFYQDNPIKRNYKQSWLK